MARPRVAVLTFWDPWEAPHGGTLRTRAFCEAFARAGAEVVCIHPRSASSVEGNVDGVDRVPVAGDTVGHRRWPTWLQQLKRTVLPMPTSMGAASPALQAALAERGPFDVLVVSHLTAVQYADHAPTARLWLDQSDLWSEFATREVATRRGPARITAELQRRNILRREHDAVHQAAAITAAGWSDGRVLAERTGSTVHWLPTALPDAGAPPPHPTAGRTVGYLANFAYHPNVDALDVLVDRWLPGITDAGWRLLVAGLGSDGVTAPPGVDVLGPVRDVDDFYRAVDATVAPVRLGGGMKVKVVESLLKGRPVLASEFALEGFPPEVRAHTHVVDVDEPDLSMLPTLEPVALPPELRARFGLDGFSATVAEVMGTLR